MLGLLARLEALLNRRRVYAAESAPPAEPSQLRLCPDPPRWPAEGAVPDVPRADGRSARERAMDGYAQWRDDAGVVWAAYEAWVTRRGAEGAAASLCSRAALDLEERACRRYAELLDGVRAAGAGLAVAV